MWCRWKVWFTLPLTYVFTKLFFILIFQVHRWLICCIFMFDNCCLRWASVGLALGQCRRRWTNVKPTLAQLQDDKQVLITLIYTDYCNYILIFAQNVDGQCLTLIYVATTLSMVHIDLSIYLYLIFKMCHCAIQKICTIHNILIVFI